MKLHGTLYRVVKHIEDRLRKSARRPEKRLYVQLLILTFAHYATPLRAPTIYALLTTYIMQDLNIYSHGPIISKLEEV